MRFAAFSDLHLDAPFVRGGPAVAALRRAQLRDALQAIGEATGSAGVDVLMCAGDLYEHERYTPDTAQLLSRVFAELSPLPVLIAAGNHDWLGPASIYRTVDWSPNVHVFDADRMMPLDVLDGVRFWGAAHLAPSGTNGFLDRFVVEGDAVHVGLFHGSELGGWAHESEADKVQHAPFRAEQVRAAGLHHAVVGHHHRRVAGTHHTYPGCPVPLAFGDAGDGGLVVGELAADGSLSSREWVSVTDFAAHDLQLDITGCLDAGHLQQQVDDALVGLRGVARVTLVGELSASLEIEPEALAARRGALDELVVRIGRVSDGHDLDAIAKEPTVRGEFVRTVMASDLDPVERQRVIITGLRALDGRDDLEVA